MAFSTRIRASNATRADPLAFSAHIRASNATGLAFRPHSCGANAVSGGGLDDEQREGIRHVWTTGDYPAVGDLWRSVGETLVDELDLRVGLDGCDLVDVATGHGTTALAAAARGASVVGVDLTPSLLGEARGRADTRNLVVRFVEGDFHDLPLEDDCADVVTSTFGVFVSAEPVTAARELARIVRPGGVIALTAWDRGSAFDDIRAAVEDVVPDLVANRPAAPDYQRWTEADGLAERFAGTGVEVDDLERRTVALDLGSPDEAVDFLTSASGPMVLTREAVLEAGADWEVVRSHLVASWDERMVAGAGTRRALPMSYTRALLYAGQG